MRFGIYGFRGSSGSVGFNVCDLFGVQGLSSYKASFKFRDYEQGLGYLLRLPVRVLQRLKCLGTRFQGLSGV